MSTTALICRRCKAVLDDWIDADWHNTTTGHNYFEIPRTPLRPQLMSAADEQPTCQLCLERAGAWELE